MIKQLIFLTMLLLTFSANADFDFWKRSFAKKAQHSGISNATITQFLDVAYFYEEAIESDNSQAEFKKFIWDYLGSAISPTRIQQGREYFNERSDVLIRISMETGVQPQIITAIWGLETSYGGFMGNEPLVPSLATLAYDSRRAVFFEAELLALLQLIDRGDVPNIYVQGSWAGGMGMTQFIPTTYQKHAVDYNMDGRRNLWQAADALASTGSYLQAMGWQAGDRWGREVQLPLAFNYMYANDRGLMQTLGQWSALGISDANGNPLPSETSMARLFVPAGQYGPKFLLHSNFDVIKKYNNADSYALAVSLLADRISGGPKLVAKWPNNARYLPTDDIRIIQSSLNRHGFNTGKLDGIMGNETRRGLQAFQASKGLVADGFMTNKLYNQLVLGL